MQQLHLLPAQQGGDVLVPPSRVVRLSSFVHRNHSYPFYVRYDDETQHVRGFCYWLRRFFLLSIQGAMILSMSVVSYMVFYRFHQPNELLRRELHFDYFPEPHHRKSLLSRLRGLFRRRDTQQAVAFLDFLEERNGLPCSELDFTSCCDDQSFTPCQTSYTTLSHPLSSTSQHYYIEIVLQLPESDPNLRGGMWTLQLDLIGSARPATKRSLRFPYRSAWVRTVRNLAILVPLLFQAADESQWLHIPMLRNQMPDTRITGARIACGAPEVTAAYLIIGEEWSRMYTLMRTWFWTSWLVGTHMFLVLYGLVWLQCSTCLCSRRRRVPRDYEEDHPCELNDDELFMDGSARHGNVSRAHDESPDASLLFHETQQGIPSSPLQEPSHNWGPDHVEPRPPPCFDDDSSQNWEDLSQST